MEGARIPVEENRRLQWFDAYLIRERARGPATYQAEHRCPCCGYPTLETRAENEICFLCGWEDGEQDDPNADEVFGDNKDYSLTEARANFRLYRTMYRPDDEELFRRTRYRNRRDGTGKIDLVSIKEDIMETYEELRTAEGQKQAHLLVHLHQLIDILQLA